MLKIEKNKILYFAHNESKKYRNLTKVKGGMFKKMNDIVIISENVTFGDFFNLLIKEKQLINLIFGASLYGVSSDLLIKDFKKKCELNDDEIQYLEIYWFVDYDKNGLHIEPNLHGISKKEINNIDEPPIALDFVPICELKNYPLRLNENLEIIDGEKLREENKTILKTTKQYTLYEIIHSILYELTWYGTPEMRDIEGKTILDEVHKIKNK